MNDNKLFDGLCICTTGLELHVKEQVRKIVLACGGTFDDDFALDTTTHLIADTVGSQKHRVAITHNVPVASPKWVFESFRAHALLDVATFELRPLEGLVICTTGLAATARDQVERLARRYGATYDANLEVGYTSVLIAQQPRGAKFDACVAHSIPVVHVSWLFACIEHAVLLDESAFALDDVLRRPRRLIAALERDVADVQRTLPILLREYRRAQLRASARAGSDIDVAMDAIDADGGTKSQVNGDNDNDNNNGAWMELFDSCGFHLVGFPPTLEAALQRIIRAAMGTIYYEMHAALVTHVLVSPTVREHSSVLAALETHVASANADSHVHFVSPKWLLDSVKSLRIESEELYPVELDAAYNDDNSIDKREDRKNVATAAAASVATDMMVDSAAYIELRDEPTTCDNGNNNSKSAMAEATDPATGDRQSQGDTSDVITAAPSARSSAAAMPSISSSLSQDRGLFHNCAFLILCCDPLDRRVVQPMVQQLQHRDNGAQAFALDARDVALLDVSQFAFLTHVVLCSGVTIDVDVAQQFEQQLVALKAASATDNSVDDSGGTATAEEHSSRPKKRRRARLTVVSDLWVNCCLAARVQLPLDAHELFRLTLQQPRALFAHPMPLASFAGVRASVSVYVGVDRMVITKLLRVAGASATQTLSKRNTHLICLQPIGMKFEKAQQWGLAIVSARWLIQSMRCGALLDVKDFSVCEMIDSGNHEGSHGGDRDNGGAHGHTNAVTAVVGSS